MPGTRKAKQGKPLCQERWASSPLLERGLKANLVALRCSVIESAEDREMVWFVQYLSLQPGGLAEAALKIGADINTLKEFCLNPGYDVRPLAPAIRKLMNAQRKEKAAGVVVTELGFAVSDALDYCRRSRCLVLASGEARLGKSFAAEHYCEQHPGSVRYVQVPSTADDLAFFMAIARGIGITIESNAKTKNLRPRIEAALQGGDLALVLDDAHYLLPNHSYRLARPSRICWLMTALINRRVPVACIVTKEFFKAQHEFTKKSGWSAAQWTGRIERTVQLPEKLSAVELERVALVHLPHGDKRSIEVLVDYASLSTSKRLAAIEHTVKKAQYFAEQRGVGLPDLRDITRAVNEGMEVADAEIAASLEHAPATASRQVRTAPARIRAADLELAVKG